MGFEATMVEVPCSLCGRSDTTRLSSRGQNNDPANVVLCQHDGFVYLSPRMDAAGYAAYYAQSYEEEYRVEHGDDTIRPVYRQVTDRLAPHLSDAPITALSVGAGLGSILHLLKDQHPALACAAIEPTPGAQRHLREVKGFDVIAGDIESDWDEGREGHYDVIIMRHVLEHLLDITSSLDRIRTTLSDEGVAYIAVPDMMHPSGSLRHSWYRTPHVVYFAATTLRHFLARSGLEVLDMVEEGHEIWCVVRKGEHGTYEVPASHARDQMSVIRRHARSTAIPHAIQRLRWAVGRRLGRG
ncbi:MAG: class I SAM-dependent methyltransferase [Candidatus Poseidoniaceae archaeon]